MFNRIAMKLASWSGDADRANELQAHLAEAETKGNPTDVIDIASLAVLVSRRAVRDIPRWIAGLPVTVMFLMTIGLTYETQFFAWDVLQPDEDIRTPATEQLMFIVNALAVGGVITCLVAGRVAVHQIRRGRIVGPVAFVSALIVAAFQTDLFIERTPWWRDGRLRPEHVNEISGYSLALFTTIALIPTAYLAAVGLQRLWRANQNPAQSRTQSIGHEIEPIALAAVALPILVMFAGWTPLVLALIFAWAAKSFSGRLKAAATIAALGPIAAAVIWTRVLSLPLDDGHPLVISGIIVSLLAIWARMTFVALRPLRGMQVEIAAPNNH